ncbi:hypothetical protein [Skermania sp. ID1734]|uniref:hypothetical protein n=1 Tax=Skermania sp. ID1734 TaxID=2597516 RepID=UPI0021031AEA|nr:hypothetical protein [Skermania sp. ID1734]
MGPLFGPGYLLLRDAVSTPRSYLTDAALGLSDAAPRAVPQDAVLAVLSAVVDGGLVVKVLLFGALWLAGWGAAMLARALLNAGTGAQLVAATVAVWNPYVAERLLQGHWSLLLGYAALPWTVCAAMQIRDGSAWTGWGGLALCLSVAGLTPTGLLLAVIVAVVTLRTPKSVAGALALAVLAAAPWLVATAVSGAGSYSDPAGVRAFAARAEPGLGTLGSLAGLGGIWDGDAVPSSRTSLFALVSTVLLLAVIALGARAALRAPNGSALAVLAAVAIVVPALAATGPGLAVMRWGVAHVPGFGLLRDTQKWVALAVPFYALAAAAGARWLSGILGRVGVAVPIVVLFAALPDLGWGVAGALRPVHYPASWQLVAADIDGPGDIAVLPGGMFRRFPYSGGAAVLDPAPRILPRDVLQTGALTVGGHTVAGENERAEQVETALLQGRPANDLAQRGVGWVLVERDSPGPRGDSQQTLSGLTTVYSDDHLALYRVPNPVALPGKPRWLGFAAHAVWVAVLAGGAVALVIGGLGSAGLRRDQPRPVGARD